MTKCWGEKTIMLVAREVEFASKAREFLEAYRTAVALPGGFGQDDVEWFADEAGELLDSYKGSCGDHVAR